jgi:hypothetical protein
LPPGRVLHVRGLSRTWVEQDLFPMLSQPIYTGLQEGNPLFMTVPAHRICPRQ